jgi:DNA repair protein RecN (Recombination protein N)
MLKELYIKNYALIEELTIGFSENLTILSGETGAGKSIIVGALGLILGEKAKTSSIRSGTDQCLVEGRFIVPGGHPVIEQLSDLGIEYSNEDGIVIRRIITISSSSRCFINGLQVTTRDLRDITDLLVDIHGQHEHQSLLNVKNHLSLLDHYGKLGEELQKYQKSYNKTLELKREIARHIMDEREKERRIDILKYSIKEVEQAQLKDHEEEELEDEYKVLKNYEKLVSSIMNAYDSLSMHESSAITMLENALIEINRVKDYSNNINGIASELETTKIVIKEAARSLKDYIDGIEYEPGRLDAIQRRLELIKSLKKKYGSTIQEIEEYSSECREELEQLEINDEIIRELSKKLEEELRQAQNYALSLSAQRRVAAHALEESIQKELSYLSLEKARFKVRITYREDEKGTVSIDGKRYDLGPYGIDQAEFLISTNVGEPLLPLKNVASGGELSRVMLAIKTVLGNVDPILTFVFDEIDAGIGGKVSWAVGTRLLSLSRYKQILCITHQAQIASKGDLNLRVEKKGKDNRTVTVIKFLEGEEKVEEIARMISGEKITEAAIRQAHEMVKER